MAGIRRRSVARRRGLLNILLLVLALAGAFAFLRSPYFSVDEVKISGLKRLRSDEVIDWSGLKGTRLIWEVDPARVAANLRRHPLVEGARVERHWPNRITIELLEREPVAALRQQELWVLVDIDGIAMAVEEEQPTELPELRGMEPDHLSLGQAVPGALREAARCAGYLKQYGIDWVKAIEVTPEGLILSLTTGDVPVYFGDVNDRPDRKLEVLNALWTSWRTDPDSVVFFDVRNPDRPVVQTDVRQADSTPTDSR